MKINKLDYLGLFVQDAVRRKTAMLDGLLRINAEQNDPSLYAGLSHGPDALALINHISLPAALVRQGLSAPARNYVFTASAQEVIDNIRVTKHLTPDRVQRLKSRVYCLNLSPYIAAFVWKTADDLQMLYLWDTKPLTPSRPASLEPDSAGVLSASLNLMYEVIEVFKLEPGMNPKISLSLAAMHGVWTKVLQTLIFLELTDPEFEIVPAGKKHSQRPFGSSNTCAQDVYVVNSNWNKYIIRTEGWGVRGHFRMQACGVGHAELKLVWVNPYQKSGVIRKPQKPE